uniref:Uncharacterized protein n=1 Tax=Nelumbo nucifera TaxID=4432 RepID=A0A822ZME8_NELNU|nr:TPA_asm: hypothetical protein HUJ06_003890 [Nelumbo nucifera]
MKSSSAMPNVKSIIETEATSDAMHDEEFDPLKAIII